MRITEIFHSIQGEGTFIGIPMLFIRTNGCNLRCKWCDSEYSFSGGEEYALDRLYKIAEESRVDWICFTGGEPLIQPDALEFVTGLVSSGKKVLIETGGSRPIKDYTFSENIVIDMDIKTPSSGEEKSLLYENLESLRNSDYVKFVIADEEDYRYAVNFLADSGRKLNAVFQPAWGKSLKELVEKVMRDGLEVRVLPQLHKLIWGEIPGV